VEKGFKSSRSWKDLGKRGRLKKRSRKNELGIRIRSDKREKPKKIAKKWGEETWGEKTQRLRGLSAREDEQ